MDTPEGLYEKYEVYKKAPPCPLPACTLPHIGEKVTDKVFVLKPETDPLAQAALLRYAQLAKGRGDTKLGDDLFAWLADIEDGQDDDQQREGSGF